MTITINHDRYGEAARFSTLADAQDTIRSCGPEYEETALTLRGSEVVDERGEVVGSSELVTS